MLETLLLPWEAITAQRDRGKEDPRLSLISGQLGAWVPGGERTERTLNQSPALCICGLEGKRGQAGEPPAQPGAPATSLRCLETSRKMSPSFCGREGLPPAGKLRCLSERSRLQPFIHPPKKLHINEEGDFSTAPSRPCTAPG